VSPTLPPRHPPSFTPYGSGRTVGMTPLSAIRWVFLPKEVFLLAAAIYLAMSLPIEFLTRRLEAQFSRDQASM
jgi:hypothetical protein